MLLLNFGAHGDRMLACQSCRCHVPSIDSPRLRVKERYGRLAADWGSGLCECGSLLLRQPGDALLQLGEARQGFVAAHGQVVERTQGHDTCSSLTARISAATSA
jgi:hypothetical protein